MYILLDILSENIYFNISKKKTLLHTFLCLLLKSSKAFSVSLIHYSLAYGRNLFHLSSHYNNLFAHLEDNFACNCFEHHHHH